MNEVHQLLKPLRHVSSQMPSGQRAADDILSHLSPATAVEALTTPAGALKLCLDSALPGEREFAVRTALASRTIWEWLEELNNWKWPSEGGPSGFEIPSGQRRNLAIQVTGPEGEKEDAHVEALTAQDVVRYEARVAQVREGLEELAVEEIKNQVLTNYILPLSRPTTPMSDSNHSRMSSSSSYNKMEDLTAVVTAIVIKILPNLARLSRLLQIWSIRLHVIQLVPELLRAIDDVERAIRLGWTTISMQSNVDGKPDDVAAERPTLTRENFNVMKLVLDKKVSNTGRSLDYMLDSLEGLPDTLPDEWLDRMEAVERNYGEWVAACERLIRENEWARSSKARNDMSRSPSPRKRPEPAINRAKRNSRIPAIDTHAERLAALAIPKTRKEPAEPSKKDRDARVISTSTVAKIRKEFEAQTQRTKDTRAASGSALKPQKSLDMLSKKKSSDKISSVAARETKGNGAHKPRVSAPQTSAKPGVKGYKQHGQSNYVLSSSPPQIHVSDDPEQNGRPYDESSDSDNGVNLAAHDEDDLELPPLRNMPRRDSEASLETTILRGASSQFDGMSSDMPEVSASPRISQTTMHEAEYTGRSPPSSPPLGPTDASSSFNVPDSPFHRPIREEDDSFAYLDDYDDTFSVSEFAGPISRRESMGDQQLRQQISEIIEGIPAKIRLSTETPRVNLNPPDLQLPRVRKKSSLEPFKRSTSNLSTRTATPSFTLSPARNVRARQSRSQQEIKVYHLSRSTGEAPIKLFIRCVGEHGERVMVRVGGGWADLSEYLKDYASHHGRRSSAAEKSKVEVHDVPRVPSGTASNLGSSPPSHMASGLDLVPSTPLAVRKSRRSVGATSSEAPRPQLSTPAVPQRETDTAPSSEESTRSRPSSRVSWLEDDGSFLGLAGPTGKRVEMSAENKAWVESVTERVRLASGERKLPAAEDRNRFGELGKVGGTKRLFPKAEDRRDMKR